MVSPPSKTGDKLVKWPPESWTRRLCKLRRSSLWSRFEHASPLLFLKIPMTQDVHLPPSTQTLRKERSMFRGCKTLPPLQFDSEKWEDSLWCRTPSWGHEDKIWTLLLLQLIQLLHRYYLVLSSRHSGDGLRLKRVHRRQGWNSRFQVWKTKAFKRCFWKSNQKSKWKQAMEFLHYLNWCVNNQSVLSWFIRLGTIQKQKAKKKFYLRESEHRMLLNINRSNSVSDEEMEDSDNTCRRVLCIRLTALDLDKEGRGVIALPFLSDKGWWGLRKLQAKYCCLWRVSARKTGSQRKQ